MVGLSASNYPSARAPDGMARNALDEDIVAVRVPAILILLEVRRAGETVGDGELLETRYVSLR